MIGSLGQFGVGVNNYGVRMKNHLSRELVLLAGPLSDLRIENSEENFVSSGGAEIATGVTAIGLAAAGL